MAEIKLSLICCFYLGLDVDHTNSWLLLVFDSFGSLAHFRELNLAELSKSGIERKLMLGWEKKSSTVWISKKRWNWKVRLKSNRTVTKCWFVSRCGSASLCPWNKHSISFLILEPTSQVLHLSWWRSQTKSMLKTAFCVEVVRHTQSVMVHARA